MMMSISFVIQFDAERELLKAGFKAPGTMMGSSREDLLFATIGSFLMWTDFYFILHVLNYRYSAEWNCRIVTAIHGVVAAVLCFSSACVFGPWPFTYLGEPNTNLHNMIAVISLGYFLFDFSWCVFMKTEGPVMLAHHLVSIVGLVYVTYQGRSASELTAVLGASEFTNPFLQIRWFMKTSNNYSGKMAVFVDWTFVTCFCVARLGVGSVFHYVCQTSPKVDIVTKAGGQAFYIISWIFGIQLLFFIHRKYIRKRPGKLD